MDKTNFTKRGGKKFGADKWVSLVSDTVLINNSCITNTWINNDKVYKSWYFYKSNKSCVVNKMKLQVETQWRYSSLMATWK